MLVVQSRHTKKVLHNMPPCITPYSRRNKEGIMNRNEFVEQYTAFVKRALEIAERARRESLLFLGGSLDRNKIKERDIFEYGINFAVDGTAYEIIEKILDNIIAREKDEYTRLYKTIQKEAVLGIQQGFNPEMLYFILNSLTDIPLKDDTVYTVISNDDSLDSDESTTEQEDAATEEQNNDIIEEDPELAEAIKNQTFVFNDIVRLNDHAIKTILRQTDSQELAKALKAASEDARGKVFKNISKRAAAMLKEDMNYMGPVRRSSAEEAQQGIINTIRQLEDTGEIIV
jgi:hypothetical protein